MDEYSYLWQQSSLVNRERERLFRHKTKQHNNVLFGLLLLW